MPSTDNETEPVDANETSDHMNKFFSSIGPKLAEKFNEPLRFYDRVQDNECPSFLTDFEEIHQLCREINTSKSSGFAQIAAKVLKSAFLVLVSQLVHMFNASFSTGICPTSWKKATVIPIFKGGDRSRVGNYRPVSLLPLPGKLVEKVVHNQLSRFLDHSEILTELQSGFRKGFSTTSAKANLTDKLFEGINGGNITVAVFVDLQKAFDTVNHSILLYTLQKYGITDSNLAWCKNYLSNRDQCTLANGIVSPSAKITCGVPQGSVLGPLFFILYVNDMCYALGSIGVQLYADDTVLYLSGNSPKKLQDVMNFNLGLLSLWCNSNKLTVNPGKTKMMLFGTRKSIKKVKDMKLYLDGAQIQALPTFKYLGLTLDNTLSYKPHTATLVKTVMHKLVLLSKVKKFLKTISSA